MSADLNKYKNRVKRKIAGYFSVNFVPWMQESGTVDLGPKETWGSGPKASILALRWEFVRVAYGIVSSGEMSRDLGSGYAECHDINMLTQGTDPL